MSLIHKHIIREFFRYFLFLMIMVVMLFVLYDYLGTMSFFLKNGISLLEGIYYVLLRIPYSVNELTPVCTILAILISFGLMNRNNEMVALQSSGVNPAYINKSILFCSLILSVFLFFNAEFIAPYTMFKANKIFQWKNKDEQIEYNWIRSKNQITHMKYYNPDKKTIYGFTRYFFSNNFNLIKRIDAKQCAYEEDKWVLYKCIEQNRDKKTGEYHNKYYDRKIISFDSEPDKLRNVVKKTQEMNCFELYATIQKMQDEGYDPNRYRVDLYSKFALPVLCFVMSIMGAVISFNKRAQNNIALSIVFGLIVYVGFWGFNSVCISLGRGEILHPFISAWLGNVVFLLLGLFYLKKINT